MRFLRLLLLLDVLAIHFPGVASAHNAQQFSSEIEAFAAADRAHPPEACSVLFVGASSIRLWTTLAQDMAPVPVINRGFGGATIADINENFDRVITPHGLRAIVFYAGENDLASGKAPLHIVADFQHFLDKKTKTLGPAPVYFISVKPSKARFAQRGQQAKVNAAIQRLAEIRDDLHYIDVVPAMLENGRPRDIFSDGLHMTKEGYAIWTGIVRPFVMAAAARPSACKDQTG